MSELVLHNANYSHTMVRTSYFAIGWWWSPICTKINMLSWMFIELDVSPRSDILYRIRTNQSLGKTGNLNKK